MIYMGYRLESGDAAAQRRYEEYLRDPDAFRAKYGVNLPTKQEQAKQERRKVDVEDLCDAAEALAGQMPTLKAIVQQSGCSQNVLIRIGEADRELLENIAKVPPGFYTNPERRRAIAKQQRHEKIKSEARQMAASGRPFVIAELSRRAGVSKTYLCFPGNAALREEVEQIFKAS